MQSLLTLFIVFTCECIVHVGIYRTQSVVSFKVEVSTIEYSCMWVCRLGQNLLLDTGFKC